MSFIAAACQNCGAKLLYDATSRKWYCDHCGYLNEKENPINYFTANIQDLHFDGVRFDSAMTVEMKMRLNAAEADLTIRKYDRALKRFQILCDDIPQEYRTWLGQIRALTEEFTVTIENKEELAHLSELYDCMMHFVPLQERDEIERQFMDYIQSQEQALEDRIHELQLDKIRLNKEYNRLLTEITEWQQATYPASDRSVMIAVVVFALVLILGIVERFISFLFFAAVGLGIYYLYLVPTLNQHKADWEDKKNRKIDELSQRRQAVRQELDQIAEKLNKLAE